MLNLFTGRPGYEAFSHRLSSSFLGHVCATFYPSSGFESTSLKLAPVFRWRDVNLARILAGKTGRGIGCGSQGHVKLPSRALACLLFITLAAGTQLQSSTSNFTRKQEAHGQFEKAEQMREALNGRPAGERTRRDYQRVADAYRKVYYVSPASSKADAAVVAVAEILAEMGRQFEPGDRDLRSAIGQYEFLRHEYPGSKYRVEALFTIGQIYKEDLGDNDAARGAFQDFLKHYPHSGLAREAKLALAELNQPKSKKKLTEEARTDSHEIPAAVAVAQPTVQKKSAVPMVTGIRHWSAPDYTRVAIDVDGDVKYEAGRVPGPDRIFFDLPDTKLASVLVGKSFDVQDGFLKKIRVAQYQRGSTRIVLEVADVSDYSAFVLPNPFRLIIDIHGSQPHAKTQLASGETPTPGTADVNASTVADTSSLPPPGSEASKPTAKNSAAFHIKDKAELPADASTVAMKNDSRAQAKASAQSGTKTTGKKVVVEEDDTDASGDLPPPSANKRSAPKASEPTVANSESFGSAAQPATAKTSKVTTAITKTASKPAETTVAHSINPNDPLFSGAGDTNGPELKATTRPTAAPTAVAIAPRAKDHKKSTKTMAADIPATREAEPTAAGQRSLTRALGLKIGRIVIDAGHGGHDTGTIGPNGLMEKDLVLDVALRLGRLLETRLGADVVYTRDDDTFIPLETRTAIANEHQADLFISVHANSSHDSSARGVETYYLNFTSNPDALEVAARENAVSEKSIHELQDLVKKITLKEKIEESHELASDVQQSLYTGLAGRNSTIRDRGVKKAPFVVLIGANMPSILAEISFVSNPTDEAKLETPDYREKIAESLCKGISKYVGGLSGVKVAAKINKDVGQ
jgi:N-acetylmuramoyl-L-alanine amidase